MCGLNGLVSAVQCFLLSLSLPIPLPMVLLACSETVEVNDQHQLLGWQVKLIASCSVSKGDGVMHISLLLVAVVAVVCGRCLTLFVCLDITCDFP